SHVPERFPETLTGDDVIATLDIDLVPTGSGFTGSTPYAYPTRTAGAVQMTSAITITNDQLITEDTGFAADGSVAWGGPDGAVTFERAEGLVEVVRMERADWSHQFIQINYEAGEGDPPGEGDFLALHYTGYLTDGTSFDSSRTRGEPFRYRVPGRLIEGWLMGTEDIRQGGTRRLIIPSELGYGSRANPRIPANSTLIFDIEAIFIERADQPGENPDEAEAIEGATRGE
ncbi:MAG: CpcT/CpeT family chromophore lyase, partial [Planctomycetota bacterium]